jgi:hypothetical protein
VRAEYRDPDVLCGSQESDYRLGPVASVSAFAMCIAEAEELRLRRKIALVYAGHQTGGVRHVVPIFREDLKEYALLVFHALKLEGKLQAEQQ